MNALQWLRIPWYSTHRSLRWLIVFMLVACAAGAVAIAILSDNPGRWQGSLALFGVSQFFLWAFFLPATLLLAIDTRLLRVPGVQRQIIGSLLLYGVLSVILPTAWLTAHGAPMLPAVAVLALCACGGLAFATMPRYLAALLGFTPAVLNAVHPGSHLRGLDDPQTTLFIASMALALLLVAVWRGRRLLLDGANQAQGWSSPMMLQLRNGSWGQWGAIGENRQLRQRPDWLRATPDLAGAGPARPDKAVRIALGGWYLPQTWLSYVRQLTLAIGLVALPLFVVVLLNKLGGRGPGAAIEVTCRTVEGALMGGLGSLAVMAGTLIASLSVALLSKRWQRVNAELPLLALLPGMGDARHMRHALLRAGLGMPLLLHTVVALLVGAAMLFWPRHARELSFLLLAQFGSATITAALLLNLFGGRRLAIWSSALLLGLCLVLTILSLLLPLLTWGKHPVGWVGELLSPLGLIWLLLVLGMLWLGRRGWQGLQRQPHPFLAC